MKTISILAAATLTLTPITASAGGLAPAIDDGPVVIMDAPAPDASLAAYIVPALFIALVAATAAAGTSDDAGDTAGIGDMYTDR